MKRKGLIALAGATLLAMSAAAQAHVDLSVGIGLPVASVYQEPVYVAPQPVVAYPRWGDDDDDEGDRHWRHERWEHYKHWRDHQEHGWHHDD